MTALVGFKILELAEGVAGEYCGKLLADLGAEVVKLERPGVGSPTRAMGPFLGDVPGTERSGLFAWLNAGKKSIEYDVDSDHAELVRMAGHFDAVIDDHAPGWLADHGLGLDGILGVHPQLVICSVTPFGQDAPPERAHGPDLIVMHASGWGYHTPTGETSLPPLSGPGRFMPSVESGLEASICVTAALVGRMEQGIGRTIDISMQEVMASRVDYVLSQMVAGDMDASDQRTAFDLWGPAAVFACREGYAYVWLSDPTHWEGLRKLLGNPEWMEKYPERWLERGLTPERVAETRAMISQWLATQDKNEVAAAAQAAGLILVPVNNAADLKNSVQYQHRGFFHELDHPVLGTRQYPGSPFTFSHTPITPSGAAPLLGQHGQGASA